MISDVANLITAILDSIDQVIYANSPSVNTNREKTYRMLTQRVLVSSTIVYSMIEMTHSEEWGVHHNSWTMLN